MLADGQEAIYLFTQYAGRLGMRCMCVFMKAAEGMTRAWPCWCSCSCSTGQTLAAVSVGAAAPAAATA